MTVGSGLEPDLLTLRRDAQALAGSVTYGLRHRDPTAGRDFHPALKTYAGQAASEAQCSTAA